jgi:quercetin dioxygenase-like cupin family protein
VKPSDRKPEPSEPMARVVDPAAIEALELLGPTIEFLIGPAEADSEPCLIRGTIPGGVAVPLHAHPDPETFVAVAGAVEALVYSEEGYAWIALRPGDVFHVPPNARHAFRNRTRDPARSIVLTSSRLGRFFREAGYPTEAGAGTTWPPPADAVERLRQAADRYGHWLATPEQNAAVELEL